MFELFWSRVPGGVKSLSLTPIKLKSPLALQESATGFAESAGNTASLKLCIIIELSLDEDKNEEDDLQATFVVTSLCPPNVATGRYGRCRSQRQTLKSTKRAQLESCHLNPGLQLTLATDARV